MTRPLAAINLAEALEHVDAYGMDTRELAARLLIENFQLWQATLDCATPDVQTFHGVPIGVVLHWLANTGRLDGGQP